MITGIRKIVVPVTDQESATAFWTRHVGFEDVGWWAMFEDGEGTPDALRQW